MRILKEFKEFAIKGNAIDLAVGIVIGAAFTSIVNSLVKDIITPPIGKLLGGVDFSNLYVNLSGGSYDTLSDAQAAGAITINYGLFVNAIISFIIVSWVLFLVVKAINRLKRQPVPQTPSTKLCPQCHSTVNIKATRCAFCTSQI